MDECLTVSIIPHMQHTFSLSQTNSKNVPPMNASCVLLRQDLGEVRRFIYIPFVSTPHSQWNIPRVQAPGNWQKSRPKYSVKNINCIEHNAI